jgi:hypothetical protein
MVDLAEIQAAYYMVAATGVLIAAIYYVFNMRATLQVRREANKTQQQQLETRQMQLMVSIFAPLFTKEIHTSFHTLDYMQPHMDPEEVRRRMKEDKDFYGDVAYMMRYFNSIGFMVRSGLLDPEKVYSILHEPAMWTWDVLDEHIKAARRRTNMPDLLMNVDYLAGEIRRIELERHPELTKSQ